MKKSLKLFLLVVPIIIMVTACKNGSYNEVDFEMFENLIEKKESFVLVIGSSQCGHCAEYEVTMDEIITTYGLDIKYINVLNLSEKERATLDAKTHYNYATPTTVFFKEGKVDNTSTIRGNQSKESVIKKLTKNEYIK